MTASSAQAMFVVRGLLPLNPFHELKIETSYAMPTATAFNVTIELVYQAPSIANQNQLSVQCEQQQFYLAIPQVARFLALPAKNQIMIEKMEPGIPDDVIHTWLYGTVFAYMLQYHGYLVLHGSAVMMNNRAVIFSGQSGAGKSTLASALVQKGYSFITDDLVVIKRNHQGQYCMTPGPTKLKLWQSAMQHFNYDTNHATPVSLKDNKYAIQVEDTCSTSMIPVTAFYELTINNQAETCHVERLHEAESLKTLMHSKLNEIYRVIGQKPSQCLKEIHCNA